MDADQEAIVDWLMSVLDVRRSTAWTFVYEGVATLEEIAYVPISEFDDMGLEAEEVERARVRAAEFLARPEPGTRLDLA